jgi:hypothetical protein
VSGRAKTRRRGRGYTMIEVAMSLGVLAIGAGGVIAMQKATLLGNINAQRLATANMIAMMWVERLRTDAVQWTDTGGIPNLAGATQFINGATPALGGWAPPNLVPGRGSPVADALGADIFGGDPSVPAFCTHLRLTQLYPDATGNGLVRAEVRVFWMHSDQPIDCTVSPASITTDVSTYGFVYVTTAELENSVASF